ncbi:MAG: site-specific DNA-methyltransferase [Roseibium sp.]|nr:site-specific DNA-methyltransferase [Roseibium sp.]
MTAPEILLDGRVSLYLGDCLEVLNRLPDNSLDSAVTDPPYHLTSIVNRFGSEGAAAAKSGKTGAFKRASAGFMGKKWDGGDIAFRPDVWREVFRVLKPGAYLLAFASTRGFGRMSCAIEDAGFIAHPLIAELHAAPGLDAFLTLLSPDQAAVFWKMVEAADPGGMMAWVFGQGFPKATKVKAEGYEAFRYGGQSLKPAIEPIFMGQKPFEKGLSGTANILKHGTGAVNIGACRIESEKLTGWGGKSAGGNTWNDGNCGLGQSGEARPVDGRWPANLIHDGSDDVLAAFPAAPGMQAPVKPDSGSGQKTYGILGAFATNNYHQPRGDNGSAARFFYSAKADADDRIGSDHPTVKPVDLMRYLVRLVTPPGGTVLDPFAGTGTTGAAAFYEGFNAVLIERDPESQADIRRRMALCLAGPDERKRERIKARQKGEAPDAGPLFSKRLTTGA